jgi:hypothetical protein
VFNIKVVSGMVREKSGHIYLVWINIFYYILFVWCIFVLYVCTYVQWIHY